jgi:hypothetical protein
MMSGSAATSTGSRQRGGDVERSVGCHAQRYERSEARRDTRAGHYELKLQLRIPKLRAQTFETAIIERYRQGDHPYVYLDGIGSGALGLARCATCR